MKNILLWITCLVLSYLINGQSAGKEWKTSADPLKEMATIRKQIKAPVFPRKDYLITAYGATGDGKTKRGSPWNEDVKF